MKFHLKNIQFITALLALAAVYVGCTKGPDIKTYTYPVPEPKAIFPDNGYAGFAEVAITGSQFGDFKNAVKVFFGGIQADTIISCEDGKIVARVPALAASGKVSLQVWTHTIDSVASFTVLPNPVITSVSDSAGVPGDVMLISGAHFGTDLSKVSASFNGTPGTVNSVEDSLISITVPASFQPGTLTLTVNDFKVKGPSFGILVAIPSPIYALDFDGNLIDRISGSVGATYTKGTAGDLTYEEGKRGQAARFPGFTPTAWKADGSIAVTNMALFKQRDFTVSCWVKWDAGRNIYPDPIFEFGEARGTRFCFLTRMGSGTNNWNGTQQKIVTRFLLEKKVKNSAGVAENYEDYLGGSRVTPPATWAHVALVYSFTNQFMKIYMDGVEIGAKNLTRNDADPFLMTIKGANIGGYAYGSGTETNFAGLMDNFRIYNQALTGEQIYTDYYKK
ncbi:MAG TPA: LamG-like jellyroll fold domain-containing protein [Niastella sp.]